MRSATSQLWIPRIVLGVAVLAGLGFPAILFDLRYLPFLLSVFLLGMSHGAADFALVWQRNKGDRKERMALTAAYVLILAGSLALVVLAPHLALLAFAVCSIWHFGSADLRDLSAGPSSSMRPLRFVIGSLLRGSIVVLTPLVFHPAGVQSLFDEWVSLSGGQALEPAQWEFARTASISILAALSLAWMVAAASSASSSRGIRRGLFAELSENAILVAASWVLLPAFFVGLYFVAWHSVRHTHHVAEKLTPRRGMEANSVLAPLKRVFWRSLPLLLPALALLALLLLANPWQQAWNVDRIIALILVFYAVVTPPHEFIVSNFFRPNFQSLPRRVQSPPRVRLILKTNDQHH